jgi:hypothetical protein
MFAIGFNEGSVLVPTVMVGRGRMLMEVYGNINFFRFGDAVRAYVFNKVVRIRAVSTPIVLRFPLPSFTCVNLAVGVAKLKKFYSSLVRHAKMSLKVVIVPGSAFALVKDDTAFAVKQASEVCFNGIHRFLGKLRANSVYRGITGLSSPKATGGLGLGFFVPPVVLKETTSG